MNKIKIILSCAVILLLIGGGITTVIGFAQPPKPMATVKMKFDPQSLTMKKGESREITVRLDCCLLRNQYLGKIETVKIGMLVNGFKGTATVSGITTKFNPEYLELKIDQTKYSYLTVSVDNTTEVGTYPLVINLYNDNSTPDMYIGSLSPYPGGANSINLKVIDAGIPKTHAFDALSVILVLLVVLIIKRN